MGDGAKERERTLVCVCVCVCVCRKKLRTGWGGFLQIHITSYCSAGTIQPVWVDLELQKFRKAGETKPKTKNWRWLFVVTSRPRQTEKRTSFHMLGMLCALRGSRVLQT